MTQNTPLAKTLIKALQDANMTLAIAESCTGGLLGTTITNISGASSIFDRGFITYTNQAKQDILGVPATTIEDHGAVSEQTATAMAQGALTHSSADIAVAITGIAGPASGTNEKPLGTVYISYALKNAPHLTQKHHFKGTRDTVRTLSVETALDTLIHLL